MTTKPNEGIQHTRALLAVTLVQSSLDVLTPAMAQNGAAAHMKKIQRWTTECAAGCKRKLSAGAKRDLDAAFHKAATFIETEHLSSEDRADAWAANMWAAFHFVIDARITAPKWASGACWRYLEQTLETLCKNLEIVFEGSEERGANAYMEIA